MTPECLQAIVKSLATDIANLQNTLKANPELSSTCSAEIATDLIMVGSKLGSVQGRLWSNARNIQKTVPPLK